MDRIINNKFIRFILVGVINTLFGTAIMFSMYNIAGCSYWASSASNYIIVSILSYILNKKFTFKHRGENFKIGLRFIFSIAVCYIVAYCAAKPLLMWIMDESPIFIQENVAMLVGMCIFTGLNYLGQRFFVFGQMPIKYKINYNKWLKSPYLGDEEKKQLTEMSESEIKDAFYKNAEFGTAGMRGVMGLGTNRINRYTVRMAAKGLAGLLGESTKVAIAYDTRNNSKDYAEEAARVLAAAEIKVFLFDRYSPVPLLSFAVRELQCDGGIVITASHNTKEYNGFKVYDNTGCQMSTDIADKIAHNMDKLEDELSIPACDINDENIEYIGNDIYESFLKAVSKCAVPVENDILEDLHVIYTPIHGSGRDFVMETLSRAGFKNVELIKEQADFNGEFPTVRKPNPGEQDALAMAGKQMISQSADILIGSDPDCDRIGVGIRNGSEVIYLTGNQMGALLIDFLAKFNQPKGRKTITSIVTGEMGAVVAASYGIEVERTLTGFKHIGSMMNQMNSGDFFMAYEESYGYLVGIHARDKDGVSAALVICQMAAYYKAKGLTLIDVLNGLYKKHGYWTDKQQSFTFEGADGAKRIEKIMNTIEKEQEYTFSELGSVKEFIDYNRGVGGLPPANVFKCIFESGSWIAIRPSGTEPKIKFYYCIKGENESFTEKTHDRMRKSTEELINEI